MEKLLNKLIGIVGIILLIVTVLFTAYIIFLSVTEYTPDEITTLEITHNQEDITPIDTPLTAITYNLGFGAYTPDFSYYDIGGSFATASDAETVVNNLTGSINTLLKVNPDFILLQEVDRNSTRSYYIDELEMVGRIFQDHSMIFSPNLSISWLAKPFKDMQGKLLSGQAILSNKYVDVAERITLPSDNSWPGKLSAPDYALLISRIPTSDAKELVLINVQFNALEKDKEMINNQFKALNDLILEEYEKENYIIVGGDFNHLLVTSEELGLSLSDEVSPLSTPLPKTFKTDELKTLRFSWGIDPLVPTVRDSSSPYQAKKSPVSIIDGFLVSNNVKILKTETISNNFKYSDHHPTYIQFELKGRRKRART